MKVPNEYRVKEGPMASRDDFGNNGLFIIPYRSFEFTVIASDGEGWEHVSVSLRNRTPNWEEMCFIKDLFWDKNEAVMQLHPPEKDYVNNAENCLHLWRPIKESIPLPPAILVGVKELGTL